MEYSQKSVSGQISLKEGFNVFLSTALSEVPLNDRIILDTGDGAAISFLGDIEDALKVGLSMRHSLRTAGIYMDTPLLVRMGINLGPVRLVKDINNQPNIVGDGINVAQRVMDFADIGQLLVSRSYYDAVSRISQEYAGMFHYQGSRTDKHVREHEVYAIGSPGEFTLLKVNLTTKGKLKKSAGAMMQGLSRLRGAIIDAFKTASNKQRALYVGVSLLAVVLSVTVLSMIQLAPSKQVVVRYYPDVEQAASSVGVLTVKKTEVSGTSSNASGATPTARGTVKADSGNKSQAPIKSQQHNKIEKPSIARVRTLEETTGAVAVMNLVVLPWGEVYLDGKLQGVSPPLIELQVAPGKHEIEIRNGNFPVYQQTIHAKAGETLKIKHTFAR